ncbi:PGN_0703 family putative restriction endonuclease [Streptomyces sp. NPDC004286]|uniref:PGN_0703 family putative restriction endonuclease n=1 Tax=Streptomyces sp. NPDC004286 TaxID=3364696 RepID=UPI0036B95E94
MANTSSNPTARPSDIQDIGPQAPGESGNRARIRFHQSWYRRHILKLPRYGNTEPHSGGRPRGSILHPEDAEAGKNFTTLSAENLYRTRRREGWGVDPIRCTGYLTSSQALTINLLAPLKEDPEWAARSISGLICMKINQVTKMDVEFAPQRRSLHLGDMTRLDAWIHLETESGPLGLAVEVKYSDRFNSRHLNVSENPKYQALANETGLWDLSGRKSQSRPVNQLLRCHALAADLWLTTHKGGELPTILVLHHPGDQSAPKTAELYREALNRPDLMKVASLDQLVSQMRMTATSKYQRTVARTLRIRYLGHELSEASWMKYLDSRQG